LAISPERDDKSVVIQMCTVELNITPDVLHCKRLGKAIPGRVQAILVTLQTAEQASAVIPASKALRKSTDSRMRNVYIIPDLTKAQVTAAYQLRCQKRQARMEKTTDKQALLLLRLPCLSALEIRSL